MQKRIRVVTLLTFLLSSLALAEPSLEAINKTLKNSRPDLSITSVKASPVAGLYEAQMDNGPVVYITADGSHMLVGDLYQNAPGELVNLTEQARNTERADLLAGIRRDDMIVFSPSAPMAVKGTVTVFTDVDCGYCQKLHKEVPVLNAMGIEVQYLAFPRAGVGSPSYDKIVSAWCASDRQAAMTQLKNRQPIAAATCPNPVADQYELGQQMGVRGTPALLLADGTMLPGYMPANELAAVMGIN